MVAFGSVTGQPHPDALYRSCFTSSHTKSRAAEGIGLVGGSDCTLVFAVASLYERPGYSKLIGRVHPSFVPGLFPTAVLHAIGPGFPTKRSDRYTAVVNDRVLLRVDG